MRLFISINFDEKTKDSMEAVQRQLRKYGRGNFTRRDNMHLTLAFLGEIGEERLDVIKGIMDGIDVPETVLEFSHIGCFRSDSELWWIGIRENKALTELQKELSARLKAAGFKLESAKFKPHITLARQMNAGRIETKDVLPKPFSCTVSAVSLMLSHRPGGVLTYTELYRAEAYKK